MSILKLCHRILLIQLGIAICGLLYRSTLYWIFPVAEGEPYGWGDMIDLGFYLSLLGIMLILIGLALVITLKKRYHQAVKINILAIVIPLGFYLMHPLVPQLMG
ncbi:MAG: hypothetical protein HRU19_00125 [Pseudobacteriovorax sp.]|nr:hypothetical protein [Pseudobacteriovorax sp.]